MSPGSYNSVSSLGSLEPGTHLCAFHRDEGQLTRIAATFIGQGLAAGDQLLYVTTDEQAEAVLGALPDDVHARDALVAGQLVVSSFADAYGTRRPDDLGTVADGFRAAAEQSRKRGFPGLRVAAQMDALAPLLGSAEEVHPLGADVDRRCNARSGSARSASTTRVASTTSSRRYWSTSTPASRPEVDETPLASFLAVHEPWGLRIFGEVDISNRDLLHRTLLSRAAVQPRIHLDLEGLRFADFGTVTRMRAVAASLPDHGWLALHRVPAAIQRLLSISGLGHERLRLEP